MPPISNTHSIDQAFRFKIQLVSYETREAKRAFQKEDVGPFEWAASIRAEAAGLAADKADQRRIIAGTPERSNYPLKYSRMSLGGCPPPKTVTPRPEIDHPRMKPSPAPNFQPAYVKPAAYMDCAKWQLGTLSLGPSAATACMGPFFMANPQASEPRNRDDAVNREVPCPILRAIHPICTVPFGFRAA